MEKRKVIVLGELGAGKSKFLNWLLGKKTDAEKWPFKSSLKTSAVTEKIETAANQVKFELNSNDELPDGECKEDIYYTLEAYDTPGIFDKSKSVKNLDSIMEYIKTNKFNQIFLVFKYGRMSEQFHRWLEVLDMCMNKLSIRSCSVIINQVPNEAQIEKMKKEDADFDLESELNKMMEEINNGCCNTYFTEYYCLVNGESEDNAVVLNTIRGLIYDSTETFENEHVRTWSEVVQFFENLSLRKISNKIAGHTLLMQMIERKSKMQKDLAALRKKANLFEKFAKTTSKINENRIALAVASASLGVLATISSLFLPKSVSGLLLTSSVGVGAIGYGMSSETSKNYCQNQYESLQKLCEKEQKNIDALNMDIDNLIKKACEDYVEIKSLFI